jgi:hypothetical protein
MVSPDAKRVARIGVLTGQVTVADPKGHTELRAGLQLAAFIDGFGKPGPQPDRGAAAAMLLLLLNNA